MRDPGLPALEGSAGAWLIGVNRKQPALQQLELLSAWLKEHPGWDKNGNGRFDYLLLKGTAQDNDTTIRTRTFKTQELSRNKT
ncbi:MAG: hypothetical protein IJ228_08135 [Succinivibrio sp.]|nr:hypothetical protein [Succinivibrio sp.]